MYPRVQRRSALPLVLLAGVVVWSACGGDGAGVEVPALEVRTATTGTAIDPDGYTVAVDEEPPRAIGPTDTLAIDQLAAGTHTVTLAGMAGNCAVQGANPLEATTTDEATTTVTFDVACSELAGTIGVSVATTGTPTDPDGFTVTLDGTGPAQPVPATGSVRFEGVAAGEHSVALQGVASQCTVTDGDTRQVSLPAGETVEVSFAVACAAAPGAIAFTSNAVGLLAVFTVNPDGSGLKRLSPADDALDTDPTWSPDGKQIAFTSGDDLYVMNADGSGRRKLADAQGIGGIRWSPEGNLIAFSAIRIEGQDILSDVWRVRPDGSDRLLLASDADSPTWSPDGQQVAYVSMADFGDIHLRIVNADAGDDHRLTDEGLGAFEPAWSPDGSRIAFVTLGEKDIVLVSPDGSDEVNLTQGVAEDDGPTWSPDGSRIVFTASPADDPLESEVAVMNRDGGGRIELTDRPGFDLSPSWAPDGQRIAYVQSGDTDSDIYVMNSDGSQKVNVTNRPDTRESTPAWGAQPTITVASRFANGRQIQLRRGGIPDPRWERLPRMR